MTSLPYNRNHWPALSFYWEFLNWIFFRISVLMCFPMWNFLIDSKQQFPFWRLMLRDTWLLTFFWHSIIFEGSGQIFVRWEHHWHLLTHFKTTFSRSQNSFSRNEITALSATFLIHIHYTLHKSFTAAPLVCKRLTRKKLHEKLFLLSAVTISSYFAIFSQGSIFIFAKVAFFGQSAGKIDTANKTYLVAD